MPDIFGRFREVLSDYVSEENLGEAARACVVVCGNSIAANPHPAAKPDEASLREALAEEVIQWARPMAPFWWLAPCAERFVRDHIRPLLDANADLRRGLEEAEALVREYSEHIIDLECEATRNAAALAAASALAARVPALEAALRPFCFGDPTLERILYDGMPDGAPCTFTIRLGDLRRARAVLSPSEGGSDAERG